MSNDMKLVFENGSSFAPFELIASDSTSFGHLKKYVGEHNLDRSPITALLRVPSEDSVGRKYQFFIQLDKIDTWASILAFQQHIKKSVCEHCLQEFLKMPGKKLGGVEMAILPPLSLTVLIKGQLFLRRKILQSVIYFRLDDSLTSAGNDLMSIYAEALAQIEADV